MARFNRPYSIIGLPTLRVWPEFSGFRPLISSLRVQCINRWVKEQTALKNLDFHFHNSIFCKSVNLRPTKAPFTLYICLAGCMQIFNRFQERARPSVLWHCWLGHVTRKTVSEMTYDVSSETLNSTIPYHAIQESEISGRKLAEDRSRFYTPCLFSTPDGITRHNFRKKLFAINQSIVYLRAKGSYVRFSKLSENRVWKFWKLSCNFHATYAC